MSSVTSSFAQKSGRTKFLLCTTTIAAPTGAALITTGAAIILDAATVLPKSTVSQDVLNAGTGAGGIGAAFSSLPAGTYRDLGREIVVYNDNIPGHPVTEVYREVLLVNGRDTEGFPAPRPPTLLAKVFSSTGATIGVSRTG